jgi:hypothetical protein
MVKAWQVYAPLIEGDIIPEYPRIINARKEYIWRKVIEPNSGLLCEEYQDP